MGNKMIVEMSLGSDDGNIIINTRESISKITKETQIEYGEEYASSNSMREILKDIKNDGKHAFEIEWKAPDKYKSLFTNLKKNKKVKFNVFINFFLKDGDGKNLFTMSGACGGAKVKDAVGIGSNNAVKQKVKLECETFDTAGG